MDGSSVPSSRVGSYADSRGGSSTSSRRRIRILTAGRVGLTLSFTHHRWVAAATCFTSLVILAVLAGMFCTARDYEIFLSYCKEDHKLARNLHRALDLHRRDVFFDEVSLPLGEPYGEVMMAAAAKCKVALLLLSEEFFSKDWPMREAQVFLQSKESGYRRGMKIVPLYFKVSRSDLQNEEKRKKWFSAWCRTRPNDNRSAEVKEQEWTAIVEGLINTSGIEFEDDSDEAAAVLEVVERVGTIARQYLRLDSEQPRLAVDDRMSELIPICQLNAGSARRPSVNFRTWFSDLLCGCSRMCKVIINVIWALCKVIINIAWNLNLSLHLGR